MNNLSNALKAIFKTIFFLCSIILLLNHTLSAQTVIPDNGEVFTYKSNEQYTDIQIPDNTTASYLYLEVNGGDGGTSNRHDGGAGATVRAHFKLGTASNEIKPGSKLRLIPGKQGRSNSASAGCCIGAGGGGGSGVLLLPPGETDWEKSIILLVAGGGGGGGSHGTGRAGNDDENGTAGNTAGGESLYNGGSTLNPGGSTGNSSGGAAAKKNATPTTDDAVVNDSNWDHPAAEAGYPTGGAGASCVLHGGWGFGGGGSGNQGGGGGGGYSGGGGGDDHGGGGGGSYISDSYNKNGSAIEVSGSTDSPQNGYVKYSLGLIGTLRLVHSSSDKCIHTKDGWMGEGAWLELWDCLGTTAQQWVVQGDQIKPFNNTDRCVTIENASETSGSQLLLWNCHGDEHQQWVYDGVTGLFRSRKNFKKCLSLGKKTIANGTKIQLMDCAVTADQQWLFDGTRTSPTSDRIHTISPAYATDKCFHTKEGSTDNGANVELVDCLGTKAQQWYFESTYIKFNGDRDKCLTLPVGDATNGANIFLEDCNGGYRQEWVYDGFTKGIRSVRTPDKCIHIKEGSSANGANVELWNCMGTVAQEFEIEY
ncbi:MAG: ricin-type beta-trefoil lectin domain protein [Phaeodactylibacter sp.]|nr:ricin-type beta-trefoil lectin domain protein [Phaeodactylibacter sp.]